MASAKWEDTLAFLKSVVAACAVSAAAFAAQAQTYAVGSNPQGSLAYAVGSAVSKAGIEHADLQMRVVPQGGPNVVIPLVNIGELDFSIANGAVASEAFDGRGSFSSAQGEVRVAAVLFDLVSGFMVRADSDIMTIADLKGKRIASEFLKQKTVHKNASAVMGLYGLSYDDVTGVPVPNGVRGVEDFETGNVDATFFSLTSGRTKQAAAAVDGGIRILPIDDTDANDAALGAAVPGAWISTLKPAKSLPGIEMEQGVFTTPFVILTSTNVSDDVVYNLVKALHGNKDALVASAGAFKRFDPANMSTDIGVPFHAGAAKFYEEMGM